MLRILLLLIFSTPFLISCGGGGTDDSSQKQNQEDNERRKAAYNRIKGVYTGYLNPRTADHEFPLAIELVLYTYDTIEATPDPNGDPVIRTVLLGQFRVVNSIGEIDDINLATAYDTKTGNITLNTSQLKTQSCPMGPDDVISIQGSLLNREFNGSIRRSGSTWGLLKLKQSDETVGEPILDQKERLERFLTPLVGEYNGPFTSTNNHESFPVKIEFRIEYVKQDFGSDFIYCPDLRGSYIRPDLGANIGTLVVRGLYRHTESSLQIESLNKAFTAMAVPGFDRLDIQATVERTMKEDGSFTIQGFNGDMNWWTSKGFINMKKVR